MSSKQPPLTVITHPTIQTPQGKLPAFSAVMSFWLFKGDELNHLLKRYRVRSGSECDAVLLAAARVEHQSWPEAGDASAGGVADARIDNPI